MVNNACCVTAQAYCPDKGYGKVLADGGKKRGGRSSRRVNMTFEDCTVLPGTQVNYMLVSMIAI